MRHAYLDRNTYLGDPDFVKNPVDRLLDKKYAEQIRAVIDPNKPGASRDMKPGTPPHEGTNTTHYSIVDGQGNAVAVTYTLNDWFGARVTAPKTGVLLNDEMDDFTVKVGVPNLYGLVQGEANSIAPASGVVVDEPDHRVEGRQAGDDRRHAGRQPHYHRGRHTILNVIDYGMDIQEAVDAPRFHQQWLPETTNVENFGLSPDTRKILEGMGHKFSDPQPGNHVAAILVGAPSLGGKPRSNYRYYGANDPRRGTGLAMGY
jgi:gamma-glutamyltranspeptidase/glutathione hydrolase